MEEPDIRGFRWLSISKELFCQLRNHVSAKRRPQKPAGELDRISRSLHGDTSVPGNGESPIYCALCFEDKPGK
jgi:hypothetical protein